jgi:GAF domain-containing protein
VSSSSISDRDLTRLLARITDTCSVQASVDQLVAFAATSFDTRYAGMTLVRERRQRFETVGATDPLVQTADELQDELGEGPCVDASVASRTVVSNDLAGDARWPTWGPLVARLGLGSIVSSELSAGHRRVGALTVYGEPERRFTREDLEMAQVLAGHAAVALRFAEQIEGLRIALESRTTIGQAQGVLMERYDVDADRAFAVLKRLSQDENVRLVEVARRVVEEHAP